MKVWVGCCGFAGGMKKYFSLFKTVEIQQTFYRIPEEKTLKKWRKLAPKDFVFNLKSFQGVTHTYTSPTWRRFGRELEGKKENYGNLQPTQEVFDSWKKTLKAVEILRARIVLIQLSAKFKDTEENLENAKRFFRKIERKNLEIAFEPRGWGEKNIKAFCKRFNLIHCVDPLVEESLWFGKRRIAYFRLHGKYEGRRINYKHDYSKKELIELKEKIKNLRVREVFIFFNNIYMQKNALEFLKILV